MVGVLLAVGLGWAAGNSVDGVAGVLAALAGLIPPIVAGVAVDMWSGNAARKKRRQELLTIFAVPKPTDDGEDRNDAG
jgi:hypothetical protein